MKVETALALSGSAAQSKIQTYSGDADFFERVNVIADTQEEACQILGQIMREKVLKTLRGDTYQLIEVKLGSYSEDMMRDGRMVKAGSPIGWTARRSRRKKPRGHGSMAQVIDGEDAGRAWWCKLDWVVADPAHGTLGNSEQHALRNVEAPDGTQSCLWMGIWTPYFQEVYLEAESVPISPLVKHVSSDALADYVAALEHEVEKAVTKDPINYAGKAAKRLYNIFRTDRGL